MWPLLLFNSEAHRRSQAGREGRAFWLVFSGPLNSLLITMNQNLSQEWTGDNFRVKHSVRRRKLYKWIETIWESQAQICQRFEPQWLIEMLKIVKLWDENVLGLVLLRWTLKLNRFFETVALKSWFIDYMIVWWIYSHLSTLVSRSWRGLLTKQYIDFSHAIPSYPVSQTHPFKEQTP